MHHLPYIGVRGVVKKCPRTEVPALFKKVKKSALMRGVTGGNNCTKSSIVY